MVRPCKQLARLSRRARDWRYGVKRRHSCVGSVAWASLFFASVGARAHDNPDRPLITVTGQAEVRVAPDEAVLRMRVVTLDKDLTVAKSSNDQSVKATLALVGGLGVTPEHIQTSALAIGALESQREGKTPLFLGYEVTKRLTVVLKDLKRADDLLTTVVKAGVNRVDGFELRHSDLRKHKDEARTLAMRAAREKATALAQEIGQAIGKAFTISEDDASYSPSSNMNRMVSFDEGAAGEGSFSAGQNTIVARVTVSFDLK
jgi:uncharacterized protein